MALFHFIWLNIKWKLELFWEIQTVFFSIVFKEEEKGMKVREEEL